MIQKITAKFDAKVLIVDDYASNRELMKLMLQMMECEVTEAASGREALEKAREDQFDVILMDIQMPEMDGVEAANALRPFTKAPIVALTAHAIEGDREKYLDMGLDDYLSKPITGAKLEEVLSRCLKRTHS